MNYGSSEYLAATNRCSRCRFRKPWAFFSKSLRSPNQQHSYCKACHREYKRARIAITRRQGVANTQAWRRRNPELAKVRLRRRRLALLYRITEEQVEDMREAQGGVCAVCRGQHAGRLVVDHNHETGRVRGLLCNRCNMIAGVLEADADYLAALRAYLESDGPHPR